MVCFCGCLQGKSVCYQALPFLFDVKLERTALPLSKQSVCLVISPLLSLMVDQVLRLNGLGIGSVIMSSSKCNGQVSPC